MNNELKQDIVEVYIGSYDADLGLKIGDGNTHSIAGKICDLCNDMSIEDIIYHFIVAADIIIDSNKKFKSIDNIDHNSMLETDLINEFNYSCKGKI